MMSITENDLERIRSNLSEIRRMIDEIERIIGIKKEEDKRLRLLKKIHDAGGIIDRNDFLKFGTECGYDTRGLGGLFVGKRSPLTYVSGGKVALTSYGEDELKRHGLI